MHTGQGQIVELILEDGKRLVRIACPSNLVPTPGQYLLAGELSGEASHASNGILSLSKCSPLPVPLYYTDLAADGFIAAPLTPDSWVPGQELHLRGPLGRGFGLPISARKVALVAFDTAPIRLRGLIQPALRQDAAVVVVCDAASEELPAEVEVQPLSALADVLNWADYIGLDTARENLLRLGERLVEWKHAQAIREAQVLIRTAMPCGGVAECGVCAVGLKSGWRLACRDGPVLDWRELAWG